MTSNSRLRRIKMAVAGVLGFWCAICGRAGWWPWETAEEMPNDDALLQVGHPNGRRWSIRRLNTLQRWSRYLKEALRGAVQAECGLCNRKHGGGLRYERRERSPRGGRS